MRCSKPCNQRSPDPLKLSALGTRAGPTGLSALMEHQADAQPSSLHQAKSELPFLLSSSSFSFPLNSGPTAIHFHPPGSELSTLLGQEGDRCFRFLTPSTSSVLGAAGRGSLNAPAAVLAGRGSMRLTGSWGQSKTLAEAHSDRKAPHPPMGLREEHVLVLCSCEPPFSLFPRSLCPVASSQPLTLRGHSDPQKPFATLCLTFKSSIQLLPAPTRPPGQPWLLL